MKEGQMQKKYFLKCFAMLLFCCAVFCAVLSTAHNLFAMPRLKTTQEIRDIAEPILDNILDGFKFDDYLRYSKDFDPALKVIGSRTKFFKVNRYIQSSLGNYLAREYMGSLRKGDMIIVLWKGTFDKTRNDVLIKLVVTERNNRYLVSGLWLQ